MVLLLNSYFHIVFILWSCNSALKPRTAHSPCPFLAPGTTVHFLSLSLTTPIWVESYTIHYYPSCYGLFYLSVMSSKVYHISASVRMSLLLGLVKSCSMFIHWSTNDIYNASTSYSNAAVRDTLTESLCFDQHWFPQSIPQLMPICSFLWVKFVWFHVYKVFVFLCLACGT